MNAPSPEITDRIVVIRNPDSSHADKVQAEVIDQYEALGLSKDGLVQFQVPSTDISESTERLAEILEPGDRLISPAGDGTGNLAVNAAIRSGQNDIRIGFLPYGNFNDMAETFTSRGAGRNPVTLLTSPDTIEARPLQILMDGEQYRYALLYANLGWTAQAAARFDDPEVRRALRAGETSLVANMGRLARSYFSERSTAALPDFTKDDKPEVHSRTTDVLAVNGPIMGRIIRSGKAYYGADTFLSSELDVSRLLPNTGFLGRSALNLGIKSHLKLPGDEVANLKIDFEDVHDIPIQLDGEYQLARVHTISVVKAASEAAARVHIIAA
jgi:diacylglycerol kinase family enzyme